MSNKIEVISISDPPVNAIVRHFTCRICGKDHLDTGRIVRIWLADAGRSGFAAESCLPGKKTETKTKAHRTASRVRQLAKT